MRFSTDKGTLVTALDAVSKVCSKNSLKILEGVLIEVKDATVSLTCADVTTSICNSFTVLDYENGSLVVDTKFLLEYIKRLNNSEIIFEKKEEDPTVLIKCGRSKTRISFMDAKDFPKSKIKHEENTPCVKVLPCNLKQALKETLISIAVDETRPILTGVLAEVKEKALILASLDGYRLSTSAVSIKSNGNFSCVIPGKTAMILEKIIGESKEEKDEISMIFLENNIIFKFNSIVLQSSILEGEFVDYKKIIPGEDNLKIQFNTKKPELENSLKRVSLLAENNKSKLVTIGVNSSEKKLNLTTSNQRGHSEEELEITDNSGDDLRIAFNVKYLLDALSVLDDEVITFKLSGPLNPIIIKKSSSNSFLALVLPVRLTTE